MHRNLEKILHHAAQRLQATPGTKPSELLGLYKKFLKVEERRLEMQHAAGAGGREVAQGRAALLDVLIHDIFQRSHSYFLQTHPDDPRHDISIVAIGGYGRGELNPYSDIDVMFLHNLGPNQAKNSIYVSVMVENVLYTLWDVGLKLGHSCRSIQESVEQANKDMQSKTAMIESRLLAGDEKLFRKFVQEVYERCVRKYVDVYIEARLQDQDQRHKKFGDTVFLQEPNVKNGCGGLRDYQNLIWMSFFKFKVRELKDLHELNFLSRNERRDLQNAYDFLLRVRNELHYRQDRSADVLSLSLQPKLATSLGYRHQDVLRRTEAFMRDYYTHTRNIFLITDALAERMSLRRLVPVTAESSTLRKILDRARRQTEKKDGFLFKANVAFAQHEKIFVEDPARLIRAFMYAQNRQCTLSPELRTLIRDHLHLVTREFQNSDAIRETFLSLLSRKGEVAIILRQMHVVGLLGKYIPEFGKLTCLVQHEFYHRYSADEHTLMCIQKLDEILTGETGQMKEYAKIFHKIERHEILYLALLLHDSGKAANADDHSLESEKLATRVADRLCLPEDSKSVLLFLVRQHLLMSVTSHRRDLNDEFTIREFARIVGTQDRLDLLMLHSFVDAMGTDAEGWTAWKDSLLWELYRRTTEHFLKTDEDELVAEQRIEIVKLDVEKAVGKNLSEEEIQAHFDLMPMRYFLSLDIGEIANHLHLIHQFNESRIKFRERSREHHIPVIQWRDYPDRGYSEVSICTMDRERLFSRITGSLTVAGINILSAQIFTRFDHIIVDTFQVDYRHGEISESRKLRTSLESILRVALSSDADLWPMIEESCESATSKRLRPTEISTEISFDNYSSQLRTIIEVVVEDRMGLLFAVTSALADAGLDISSAKISTEKGAAIDTFYVTNKDGQKILDPELLKEIRTHILESLSKLPQPKVLEA